MDWKQLREEQRQCEWELRSRLLKIADHMLTRLEESKGVAAKGEDTNALKVCEAVSKLGRLACGGLEVPAGTEMVQDDFLHVLEQALDRVEGRA